MEAPTTVEDPKVIPLVFIHGIKGSSLIDKFGKTLWITTSAAIGLSTPNLSLPIRWKQGIQERDEIQSATILRKVGFVKVYEDWLNNASKIGRPIYSFSYDWRRDNNESFQLFDEYISEVYTKHKTRVQVIAHSMGGLISFAVLNHKPDLFHSILFAGVPFGRGVGFLKDVHQGIPTGLNHKILSPNIYFTFSSQNAFFPEKGTAKFVDDQGNKIDIDLMNVNDWITNKLGIFSLQEPTEEMKIHLETSLEKAILFRSLIEAKDIKYPPIAVLASKAHPTTTTVMKDGPYSVRGYDFESMPKEEGDGRVTFKSSLPPKGVPYNIWESKMVHSSLLSDPIVIEIIQSLMDSNKE